MQIAHLHYITLKSFTFLGTNLGLICTHSNMPSSSVVYRVGLPYGFTDTALKHTQFICRLSGGTAIRVHRHCTQTCPVHLSFIGWDCHTDSPTLHSNIPSSSVVYLLGLPYGFTFLLKAYELGAAFSQPTRIDNEGSLPRGRRIFNTFADCGRHVFISYWSESQPPVPITRLMITLYIPLNLIVLSDKTVVFSAKSVWWWHTSVYISTDPSLSNLFDKWFSACQSPLVLLRSTQQPLNLNYCL
jgi:hypothetical protein